MGRTIVLSMGICSKEGHFCRYKIYAWKLSFEGIHDSDFTGIYMYVYVYKFAAPCICKSIML